MMKKILIIPCVALIASAILLLSCEKKKDSGIGPGFKEETGTGGNPNPNAPTVTGTSTNNANPATQSSYVQVSGPGWTNPNCATTGSATLKGINGIIEVTLNFLTPPSLGTYTYPISAAPSGSTCAMMVQNAPNQPAGTIWYAKSGVVAVNSTTASISAAFTNIQCTQQDFNFPTVTMTGSLTCGN